MESLPELAPVKLPRLQTQALRPERRLNQINRPRRRSRQQPAIDQPPPNAQDAPPAQSLSAVPNIVVNVNFVQVPVTVKDSKGNLVSGLTWRDFTVYENNTRERLSVFSVDPQPLSIAFVIDQTVPSNVMTQVNNSMGSIQGALAPYDEAAVFTYTNGPKEWTGFTAAQSARLPAVLSLAQATGSDPMVPDPSDPFSACSISINGNCPDPDLQPGVDADHRATRSS